MTDIEAAIIVTLLVVAPLLAFWKILRVLGKWDGP